VESSDWMECFLRTRRFQDIKLRSAVDITSLFFSCGDLGVHWSKEISDSRSNHDQQWWKNLRGACFQCDARFLGCTVGAFGCSCGPCKCCGHDDGQNDADYEKDLLGWHFLIFVVVLNSRLQECSDTKSEV